jgi:Zn-dependent peptidase ImmA (M78 family)/transcriptional regulator with XRE-family HTH domain
MTLAKINPEILKWAIKDNNYNFSEFSKKVGKSVKVVERWTKGEEYPTYIQLERISYNILKLPIAIFFFPSPPIDRIKKAFRTLPDIFIEELSPFFIRLLRKSRSLQLNLKELCNDINPSNDFIINNFNFNENISIQEMSSELRKFISFSLEDQFSWKNTDDALKNWRNALENKGLYIFKDAFKDDKISGFSFYDEKFPIIVINNSFPRTRQIFTIFHELAHILFKTAGIDLIDDSYINELCNENKNIEIYCNQFASEFLVPIDYFKRQTFNINFSESITNMFSQKYLVSREVILRKFYDINKLSRSEYEFYSRKWIKEAKEIRSKKGTGGNYYLNKINYYGKDYLDLAFKKYYTNQISIQQLSDYLNIKETNISSLESFYRQ